MSNEKRRFVQTVFPLVLLAQYQRNEEEMDAHRALQWAEAMWQRLCEAGYGPPAARGPHPIGDRVAALGPEHGASFARLWDAYRLPKGKQEAAQRWAQIAPDAALAETIIAAAAADAREVRPEGAVRKWLQGWLAERRWEDRPAAGAAADPKQQAIAERRAQVQKLLGEHGRLCVLLHSSGATQTDRDALARLEEALRGFGIDLGAKRLEPSRAGLAQVASMLQPPNRQEPTP